MDVAIALVCLTGLLLSVCSLAEGGGKKGAPTSSHPKKLLPKRARSLVMKLPEVKAWDAFIRKQTKGNYGGFVMSDSDQPERFGGRKYLQVSFMEDGPDMCHRWKTFEVDVVTGKVMVLDEAGDWKLLTLKQWRKRQHPMEGIK